MSHNTTPTPHTGDIITTAEQLNALPPESITRDRNGDPWRRGTGSWVSTSEDGDPYEGQPLPATVLYVPGEQPHRADEEARADGYCTCDGPDAGGRMGDCGIAAHRAEWAAARAVDRITTPPAGEEARAVYTAAMTVKETGGAVEIAGVRIEPCDTHGQTDTTRAAARAVPSDHTALAEAWEQGRQAEREYRSRQDDAEAAGQGVQIPLPLNPYGDTATHWANGVRRLLTPEAHARMNREQSTVPDLRGLLATARPDTTTEPTVLARLTSTLDLRGVWDASVPPGGYVCPWCGDPWESEQSCEHAQAVISHDHHVSADALEDAAEDRELANIAGEPYARLHDARWLHERAATIRKEADR